MVFAGFQPTELSLLQGQGGALSEDGHMLAACMLAPRPEEPQTPLDCWRRFCAPKAAA